MKKKAVYHVNGVQFTAKPLEPALYLVATPIGNLGDITLRALETLASVDFIACEDTRTSKVLLDRYQISTKLISYHQHNEASSSAYLLDLIRAGQSVALISDAGTPLISDPGTRVVIDAQTQGITIVPLPGACAFLAALSMAGLPTTRFLFEGFLPAKQSQRRERLASLASLDLTLLFYEAPHRLHETLHDMSDIFGENREAAVCRELTKKFEESIKLPLTQLIDHYHSTYLVRGEIVILVAPPTDSLITTVDKDALLHSLLNEMPASKAAAEAARLTGGAKAELYKRILELKNLELKNETSYEPKP
jgi:16S rRNA (cytidine1402-2'-O)-methyltransferase